MYFIDLVILVHLIHLVHLVLLVHVVDLTDLVQLVHLTDFRYFKFFEFVWKWSPPHFKFVGASVNTKTFPLLGFPSGNSKHGPGNALPCVLLNTIKWYLGRFRPEEKRPTMIFHHSTSLTKQAKIEDDDSQSLWRRW